MWAPACANGSISSDTTEDDSNCASTKQPLQRFYALACKDFLSNESESVGMIISKQLYSSGIVFVVL